MFKNICAHCMFPRSYFVFGHSLWNKGNSVSFYQDSSKASYAHKPSHNALIEKVINNLTLVTHHIKVN